MPCADVKCSQIGHMLNGKGNKSVYQYRITATVSSTILLIFSTIQAMYA